MDEATIAGELNLALNEASGSIHFHEHFNLLGDTLVLEYHFKTLPEKIDLERLRAVFERVDALYWSGQHGHSTISMDGVVQGEKVSVLISLKKEMV
jgi:hypothetical protein